MFYRNQNQSMIAGVAAGIADKYDVSVTLVRILFVLGYLFFGIGLVAYLIGWMRSPGNTGQATLI